MTADQLPGVDGINVMLGKSDYPNVGDPWTIIDIDGWTDVNAIDYIAAATINDDLDIPFAVRLLTWDGYTAWTTGEGQTHVYDFMDYCMHWGINGDLYERYMQLFTGWSGVWNHYSGYANPILEAKIQSLDTLSVGSAARQARANEIFAIVGRDLPYIPMSGHPDWYIYSDKYWTGWPNEDKPFLPDSPYGGATQEANLLYVLLSLGAVGTTPPVPPVLCSMPMPPLMPEILNKDGKIDIKDIAHAAKAFGSYPSHLRWDIVCDLNNDGKVDIKDISRIAKKFGKTY